MVMEVGPLRFYRAANGTLDISLICLKDAPCGWEYGWRDDMRGTDKPWIELRVGKLLILYFSTYDCGFEAWFMGFWGFVTFGKEWWQK